MSTTVDSSNKAHSIMGPECSYCRHRKGWHLDGECSPWKQCPCVEFDNGTEPVPKGWLNIGWHQLVRRHHVEDLSTYIPQHGRRDKVLFHFRCSCGKEWVDPPAVGG